MSQAKRTSKDISLRTRVGDNIAIWFLETLLTGFLAGIATHSWLLDTAPGMFSGATSEIVDTQSLYKGGFLLGISYTWASTGQAGNFAGAKTNYVLAQKALAASNAFADMNLVDSVGEDLNLGKIADPKELARKVHGLHENLSGQLVAKK